MARAPKIAAPSGAHVLVLPKPPSVNDMFANSTSRKGGKRGGKGRYPTARYAKWKTAAGYILNASRPPKISGPYELSIQLGRRKGSDLGNFEKGISDLLVSHGIVTDDSLCECLTIRWAPDLASNQCRIEFAASVAPGLYVDQTEVGAQLSIVPPANPMPKKSRASLEIIAMSKLRDFAKGAPNTFTPEELESLEAAGLIWMHPYPTPRPLLTEAGWSVVEGAPEPQKGRGAQ